ncbi:MAG TPA: L-alanine-DL-glutamate epimerase, partial [Cyclobacteriaceae bacterium]
MPGNQELPNQNITRREFVTIAGSLMAMGTSGFSPDRLENHMKPLPRIRVRNVDSNFEREPLYPYRFKGSFVTELWQAVAYLESESGIGKIGLGTQSVLWSDAKVFAEHSVTGGNALMFATSERALQIIKGNSFADPIELL